MYHLFYFQRKDHRVLTECLPGKQEYILKFRLGEVQEKLYVALLNNKGSDGAIGIFKLFNALLRVSLPWYHACMPLTVGQLHMLSW